LQRLLGHVNSTFILLCPPCMEAHRFVFEKNALWCEVL
jgi:hypothetical protein